MSNEQKPPQKWYDSELSSLVAFGLSMAILLACAAAVVALVIWAMK